jgi:hypothetical protein
MPHTRRVEKKRSAKKARQTKRSIEGAALATIDSFMDMIGTRQDAPLRKPTPQNKLTAQGEPYAVRALDFIGIVFADKVEVEKF